MARAVTVRHVPTASMDEELVRTLWRMRLDYFPLGARSEAEDWNEFSAFFARDRREAIVFFDQRDEVVGFYVNSFDLFELRGRKSVFINIEYTYMREAYRGHPRYVTSGFRMFFRLLRRYPGHRFFYGGYNFPNSFASVNTIFGHAYTLQEDMPEFEREVLRNFAARHAGSKWDPEREVAVYKNIPPEIPGREAKPARIQALLDRYERINPNWRQGDCIAVLIPVNLKTFVVTAWGAARRVLKERRRKRSARTPVPT